MCPTLPYIVYFMNETPSGNSGLHKPPAHDAEISIFK